MANPKAIPEMTRLRHELLRATERATGAEAKVADLTKRLRACQAERDRLAKQLGIIRGVTTSRVGRALLSPATAIRRRLRR